jgi:hypothetical protein
MTRTVYTCFDRLTAEAVRSCRLLHRPLSRIQIGPRRGLNVSYEYLPEDPRLRNSLRTRVSRQAQLALWESQE